MTIVVDSSVLIGLGSLGHLALLHDLFGEVVIPEAVFDEVVDFDRDSDLSHQITEAPWIRVERVENELAVRVLFPLDRGESECVVLCLEQGISLAAVDDKPARERVEALGVGCVGTLAILLKAKQSGLIDRVRPLVEELRRIGFSLAPSLVEIILDMAGEFSG